MKELCDKNNCTACSACENICNKNAIVQIKRWDGSWYMTIDEDRCIDCNLCRKVCPSLNTKVSNKPMKAFAAWSKDSDIHRKSASGGIASELYLFAIRNGWSFVGVQLDERFDAYYCMGETECDIEKFRNSKYSFSNMGDVYKKIEQVIKKNKRVLFIGLPCHVSAVKSYFTLKKLNMDYLVTVDLVCHGTPSPDFLKQHIKTVEEKKGKKTSICYFRDPNYNTDRYFFTLYDVNGNRLYKKKIKSDDTYQIGYHSALIYRDSCYSCMYAKREREGDITISDYHGLGSKVEYRKSRYAVSCILVNTVKGKIIVEQLNDEKRLQLFERPLLEPLEGEPQFNHPSVAPVERETFIKEYIKYQSYDMAAERAFKEIKRQSIRDGYIDFNLIRIRLSSHISPNQKSRIKKILKLFLHKL
ncbi:MAG: Coenzyme F420 hydrogenase/dehydrogenase, beta subunit C-terminal domain [Lachnospiraceae bacterium]|nr:Coenzyme F420 hydrogenase/dehydrogenase, beta subunit C-terminal domain [Lachnospiraceae bacterium]